MREPRPPRSSRVSGIPEDLDRLCCALLRRHPRGARTAPRSFSRLGGEIGRSELSSPVAGTRIVAVRRGRKTSSRASMRRFLETEKGRGVTVRRPRQLGRWARPSSCAGFLTASFARGAGGDPGWSLLRERCSPLQGAGQPHGCPASHHLKRLTDSRAEVSSCRATSSRSCACFPVLRRVEAVVGARRRVLEIQDVQELRRRACGAFRELMAGLAEESPLVLFIDDPLIGGTSTARLCWRNWCVTPDPPPLLLILAYRGERGRDEPVAVQTPSLEARLRTLARYHRRSARSRGGARSGPCSSRRFAAPGRKHGRSGRPRIFRQSASSSASSCDR